MGSGRHLYSVSWCVSRAFLLLTKQGRETFLVPVDWVDDWPVFNGGRKISLQSGEPAVAQKKPRTWIDDFSKPDLQLGWYRKSKYNFLCYRYLIQRSNKGHRGLNL